MIIDSVRLMLFPTIMAFAAASDLLTMTISNRVPIILAAGFAALALTSGMPAAEILSHAGAAALVLVVSFGFFVRGWIGGGDAAGRDRDDQNDDARGFHTLDSPT